MVECRVCGRNISSSADPCPGCGEPKAGARALDAEMAERAWRESPQRAVEAAEQEREVRKANLKFLTTAVMVVIVIPVIAMNMGVNPWIVVPAVLAIIVIWLLGVVSGIIITGVLAIIAICGRWLFS